jgi:autotransporter-associated beta strand protein
VANLAALELQNGISVGAEALTLNGTGVSSGGALRNISGNNTYGGLLTLGSASRINSDSGTLTLANAGTVSGAFALTVGGAGDTVFNSILGTSSGTLTKDGTGALVLGGASTYTGGTAINNGTVRLDLGNDRLPTGTVVSLGQESSSNLGTLDLNGRNQSIAGLVSTTGINSSASKNTVTSATAATLEINVASGTTKSYGDGTTQNSGVIGGLLALTKSGSGTQVLGDANTYTGTTTVNAGTLTVNGSLLNTGSVVVNANGFLGGSGKVGAITGAGTVGPGNSPGILTATSVNPTAGTDFKFEITSANPIYTTATASGNDLLHLTAASPFAGGTFTAGNVISIYLNSATITTSLLAGNNTTFSGAFFVDGTYALASALTPASFVYYTTSSALGTGSAVDYNGINYYLLDSAIAAKTTLSDTAVSSANAGFSTGAVAGTVLTFNAVPEPSAQSLLAIGMVALVAVRALRRGREDS